ncbi:MAG TPA: amidohydrolase family protein [Candidatus Baltobacteraceae bacterium]|nr:amidohydrolase family protein [Candidatus Baltobacteraceae bacterium]
MIIRAGTLYDGSLSKPRQNVDIEIADGKILAVRNADGGAHDREAACVTPGLVNAHVHMEMNGEANTMGALAAMTQNERLLHAVENARKSVKAGVTTVRDVGSSNNISPALRDAIAKGQVPGPRMRAAGAVLCMTGGHGWFVGRQIDGPWDARKAVREQLMGGADCIKLIATGGVLTKGAVPGNAQLLPEELEAAIDEAHRHDLRVAAHAIGTQGIKNALRTGVDSIEHGHLLDDEAIELFKKRNAYLVPTLTAPTCILEHLHDGGQPEFVIRKAEAIGEVMRTNIKRAYDAGVKIAGGSDAGTPFNYHENYAYEVELMHTLLGMTPHQALHAATAVAAELIGLHRGLLEPGEPADLLLLDADLARDVRILARPQAVVQAGRFVGA